MRAQPGLPRRRASRASQGGVTGRCSRGASGRQLAVRAEGRGPAPPPPGSDLQVRSLTFFLLPLRPPSSPPSRFCFFQFQLQKRHSWVLLPELKVGFLVQSQCVLMTKPHGRGLKRQACIIVLTALQPPSPRSGCPRGRVPVRTPSWVADGYCPPVSTRGWG